MTMRWRELKRFEFSLRGRIRSIGYRQRGRQKAKMIAHAGVTHQHCKCICLSNSWRESWDMILEHQVLITGCIPRFRFSVIWALIGKLANGTQTHHIRKPKDASWLQRRPSQMLSSLLACVLQTFLPESHPPDLKQLPNLAPSKQNFLKTVTWKRKCNLVDNLISKGFLIAVLL